MPSSLLQEQHQTALHPDTLSTKTTPKVCTWKRAENLGKKTERSDTQNQIKMVPRKGLEPSHPCELNHHDLHNQILKSMLLDLAGVKDLDLDLDLDLKRQLT